MHSTLSEDVKGFVDEIRRTEGGDRVFAKGWAFYHRNMDVLELRLVVGDQMTEVKTHIRSDVGNHYMNNAINECGWEVLMNIGDVGRLDMNVYGQWVPVFYLKEAEKKAESVLEFKPLIKKVIPSFLVVDDFYEDPDSVREFALKCNFKEHKESHKGKRTEEFYRFDGLKERFEQLIGTKIKGWEKYPTNACFQYCVAGDQVVYHKDLQRFAGVLYLTPNAPIQSGTALYRSTYNHKMRSDNSDHNEVFAGGFLDPTRFEEVDKVGNVYNRLILFDSQMTHSGLNYFGTDKNNSRLFQLFFFDLEE